MELYRRLILAFIFRISCRTVLWFRYIVAFVWVSTTVLLAEQKLLLGGLTRIRPARAVTIYKHIHFMVDWLLFSIHEPWARAQLLFTTLKTSNHWIALKRIFILWTPIAKSRQQITWVTLYSLTPGGAGHLERHLVVVVSTAAGWTCAAHRPRCHFAPEVASFVVGCTAQNRRTRLTQHRQLLTVEDRGKRVYIWDMRWCT